VREFIAKHPDAIAVYLGCGLDVGTLDFAGEKNIKRKCLNGVIFFCPILSPVQ
jgi:hypothetical protein